MNIKELAGELREFADERDWNQFHSPKNLAMALIVEAGELLEHFQWLKEEESASLHGHDLAKVATEIADVQIYLIRIADVLEIDIENAVQEKIKVNKIKYPADVVRGSSKKYSTYHDD